MYHITVDCYIGKSVILHFPIGNKISFVIRNGNRLNFRSYQRIILLTKPYDIAIIILLRYVNILTTENLISNRWYKHIEDFIFGSPVRFRAQFYPCCNRLRTLQNHWRKPRRAVIRFDPESEYRCLEIEIKEFPVE